MNLHTLDEDRIAFVRSALNVLKTVDAPASRLCRLISGCGGRRALTPQDRRVVYEHWALLAALEAAGHLEAIQDEILGIVSCVESDGVDGAASAIASELPDLGSDGVASMAA